MNTRAAGGVALLAGLVCVSPAAEPWQPLGLGGGGAMFSLAGCPIDPNVMMLSCDMSGAYVSRDAGRTWRMIHHRQLRGCTSCSPVFHPSLAGRVYGAGGWSGRLRASDDYGETWKEYGGRPPWRSGCVLLWVDPIRRATRLFAGLADGLYKTDDDGRSWTKCTGIRGRPLGIGVDRRDIVGVCSYYVGTTDGVFCSGDGGRTFERFGTGLPDGKLLSFAVGSNGKVTHLYATVPCKAVGGRLTGGVYVSRDHGRAWRRCMNPDLNVQTKRSSKWAHGDVPEYRYVRTTDEAPGRAYVYDAGTSYFPPNHATVYRTDDAGAHWRAVLFSDPRFKRCNVTDDYLSSTIGQRYQEVPLSFAVNPGDPDVVMAASAGQALRTDDGGRTWRTVHCGPRAGGRGKETAWLNNGLVVTTTWNYYADPHEPRRHYICYTDIGFARSLDGGRSWIWAGPSLPWRNTTYELAFDPAVRGRIWAALSNTHDIPNWNVISGRHRVHMAGGVARSDDFGRTWQAVKLPPAPALSVVLDPTSPKARRRLYASLFEKGVYRSDDGGATWAQKSSGLGHPSNMRCCKLQLHVDGALFVLITAKRLPSGDCTLDGVGLYRSDDRAESWTKINRSLPLRWPKDFTVKPTDSRTILLSAANLRGREEGGLYRTTDGGQTWKKLVQKGPEHFGAFYHPARGGWIYMTLTEGARECGLWLSRDDGKTWQPFGRLPFSNIQRVHFLAADRQHIVVTTFGGSVYRGPVAPAP